MKINRWICDFGNSINQHLIDGYYFEMPSSIYEITEKEARGIFAEAVDRETLLQQLVIRVTIDGKNRFFKVGEKAKGDVLGNAHIEKLHDKTESLTVWVTWLAGAVFYHSYQHPDKGDDIVEISYFLTMLPTWLVKKADKFTDMLSKMADRFKGNSTEVELLTPNFERTLTIEVEDSVCRIEGETARFALQYDLELNPLESAKKFEQAIVVIDDIGGQTQDLSKLRKGLKRPESADDFASFTDQSYLKTLEKLRTTKLMTHFNDVRSLESFILENISKRCFIYLDPTTKKETDFTEEIDQTLCEFVKIAMQKALTTFHFLPGVPVYFVHIGGVASALQEYIKEYLNEELGEKVAGEYHLFPADSRKLNLYGGEIVAKSELKKREGEPRNEETAV
ncbi:hypothetical protein [Aneurinibacillus terranovensis]|uniref:Alp7A family actin-like protein n=1 Tax=Aneurinibacillus terranovensis TaxID=278991 RepID=UPI0003F88DEF|nr:hypothetical protein [Aneurinibacillus terranovensis]